MVFGASNATGRFDPTSVTFTPIALTGLHAIGRVQDDRLRAHGHGSACALGAEDLAWVFERATNAFRAVGRLGSRAAPGALSDGTAVVFGASNTAGRFDPTSVTFTSMALTNLHAIGRVQDDVFVPPATGPLATGHLAGTTLAAAERLAPGGVVERVAWPRPWLAASGACGRVDGRAFYAGGIASTPTASSWVGRTDWWDPWTLTLHRGPELLFPRAGCTIAELIGRDALLVGGGWDELDTVRTAELWDLATGRITHVADLIRARTDYQAVALQDGRVLVNGGTELPFAFAATPAVATDATELSVPPG